jgi:predicted MFS family arabinose efflux permease
MPLASAAMSHDAHPLRFTLGVFGVGKLLVGIGTRFVYAFLPAIARGLGVSLGAAGALASVRWAAGAATPMTIRLAGREHRRRVLLLGLTLYVAGALVTAFFGVYAGALAGFVLMGIGKPVFDSGTQAVVADRVPYQRRGRYLGTLELAWALSFLVGAPLSGLLISRFSWSAPFLVLGVALLAVIVAIMRDPLLADGSVLDRPGRISWDRPSRAFLAATILLVGSAEFVFITFAAWLEDVHGFGVAALAVVAGAIGIGELVAEGASVLLTDRLGKGRAVAVGLTLEAAGFIVVALLGGTLAVAVVGLVLGICGFEFGFVSSIPLGTELQPAARIQFLSRFVVAQAFGRAVAALVGIGVFALAGITGVGVLAAVAALAAAAIMQIAAAGHDHRAIVRTETP